MEGIRTNRWWVAAAIVMWTIGALSLVQAAGFWIISEARGEPTPWMFIDHAGPAVTSLLIGVATLAIGIAAALAGRRRSKTTPSDRNSISHTIASTSAFAAALFFVLGMIVIIGPGVQNEFEGSPPPSVIVYVFAGLAFHFALLPVISALPAPAWATASGYVWVVVDNMILMLTLYSTSAEIINPLRWGIHLAAATWFFGASLRQSGVSQWVGFIVALGMAGASLGGGFTESALLLLRVSGPLVVLWLILVGIQLSKANEPARAGAPASVPLQQENEPVARVERN
ncbi:hypothetical protein [Agromyces binzhouensis]|uniref:hypothetical protein n=1 Tax=Agromyces binzhouensis TaxID=1817495 RepID=UPI0036431520